jgi:hypothetical protein
VSIFANPAAGTFATAGVSESSGGALSTADSDQVHIRYNSAGYYEIQMPAAQWEGLVPAPGGGSSNPVLLAPASAQQGGPLFIISDAKAIGYQFSELAFWRGSSGRQGWAAFGTPTAASQVPVSGTATYAGMVSGTSDVVGTDDQLASPYDVPIEGTVTLTFDFGQGTLGGSMSVSLVPYWDPATSLGTFSFIDTVYSSGSATYSGKFDTSVGGSNYFLGRFTGPNAEETIGAWALPFVLGSQNHQGFGGWIAKK